MAPAHLYIEGVADLVDPDLLAERVKVITMKARSNLGARRCRSPGRPSAGAGREPTEHLDLTDHWRGATRCASAGTILG
jgi:hypothetical protein